MFVRAYLRASTDDQNANWAHEQLRAFAEKRSLQVAVYYVENESGAKLIRPELFCLRGDSHSSDVLVKKQVDRLSRLTSVDWELLGAELSARQVPVVALDLPTTWMLAAPVDEFIGRMFAAANGIRSTFSQPPPARTTRIAAAAKLEARSGPRLSESTRSARGHQAQRRHRRHAQARVTMDRGPAGRRVFTSDGRDDRETTDS